MIGQDILVGQIVLQICLKVPLSFVDLEIPGILDAKIQSPNSGEIQKELDHTRNLGTIMASFLLTLL